MRKLVGCLILGCMLATPAHADLARMYYGAGFSDGTVEVNGGRDRSLGTVNATLGLQLFEFVGIELQGGVASDDTGSILSDPLVSYGAAMVRLGFRVDRVGVYVLGGQAFMDIDRTLNPSDSGTAFGLGINLFGNETTALNFNFLSLDGGVFTAATIGFQYYFGGFR